MTSRFPVLETALTGVAVGSLVTLAWLAPSPYLAPTLAPYALGVSFAWMLGCLWRLARRLTQWHRWRVSQSWQVAPEHLCRSQALLGKGFRWEAVQVECVERALLRDGRLPEGRGPRGGYPALHATGIAREQEIRAPWQALTTHIGLIGMTGSGKSRALESLLTQAIGADDEA
jgi:hypothetical protein